MTHEEWVKEQEDIFCYGCINETCSGCPIYEQAVKDDNDDEHDEDGEQDD